MAEPEQQPVSFGEAPAVATAPLSAEAMAALQSPLMASPAALAQYANLGALPFATQPANLGALYGAAGMGRGAEGGLVDMSAYQQFNVANLAQYQVPRAPPPRGPGTPPPRGRRRDAAPSQAALASQGYPADQAKLLKSRGMYAHSRAAASVRPRPARGAGPGSGGVARRRAAAPPPARRARPARRRPRRASRVARARFFENRASMTTRQA